MKILVTGGAGYKGIVLTEELLKLGYDVTVLDNFMFGTDFIISLLKYPNLNIVKKDIRSVDKTDVSEFDVIFHLAGLSGYPACENNPDDAQEINFEATKKMVGILGNEQILIYASTTYFYGKDGLVCNETTPIFPITCYGVTKYNAEQEVMKRNNSISLRFATVFGVSPKMRVKLLVNDFCYRAVTDGNITVYDANSKRTFIHVKDVVKAYVFSMNNSDKMMGEVYNVGDESLNFSKIYIAEQIQKEIPSCTIKNKCENDYDSRNFIILFDKIRSVGFKTDYTLNYGIKEMIRLFKFYSPLPNVC